MLKCEQEIKEADKTRKLIKDYKRLMELIRNKQLYVPGGKVGVVI